mgnify:CR=1 FL=1
MSSEALIKAAWNRYSSSVWSTPLQFGGACADEAHRFVERVSGRWERAARTMEEICLLYTSPSPRDGLRSRMPSSA